jgi:hypothetical protein
MATSHIGLIVTGCLIGGLVAALALVVGPVAGAQEHVITGTVLLTFSSTNSSHRLVLYTHDALVTDRTAADASTQAIRDVVHAARSATPLKKS